MSYLIKDTTEEERRKIVEESLGNLSGACDGCSQRVADMYDAYIRGEMEHALCERRDGKRTALILPDVKQILCHAASLNLFREAACHVTPLHRNIPDPEACLHELPADRHLDHLDG